MDNLCENKNMILEQEKKFAALLAKEVLNKPNLSSWMIFIPFLFIFYIQDLMKFKKKRKEFLENYILSREKALNESKAAIKENRKPDTNALAQQADLMDKATEKYAQFLFVLANHYTYLLKAKGDDYKALVRSAYGKQRNQFVDFMTQLNNAEKKLNTALLPKLRKAEEGVKEIIKKIEKNSENMRREQTKEIFGLTF